MTGACTHTRAQLADALALVDELLTPWAAGSHLTRDDQLLVHAPFTPAAQVADWRHRRLQITTGARP